jgi:hypothetical protein
VISEAGDFHVGDRFEVPDDTGRVHAGHSTDYLI